MGGDDLIRFTKPSLASNSDSHTASGVLPIKRINYLFAWALGLAWVCVRC